MSVADKLASSKGESIVEKTRGEPRKPQPDHTRTAPPSHQFAQVVAARLSFPDTIPRGRTHHRHVLWRFCPVHCRDLPEDPQSVARPEVGKVVLRRVVDPTPGAQGGRHGHTLQSHLQLPRLAVAE